MVSASVIAAETTEEARYLGRPEPDHGAEPAHRPARPDRVAGDRPPPAELSELDRILFDTLPGTQYAGTADEVVAGLDELVERTGADELMLAGTVYDPATRQDTLRRGSPRRGAFNRVHRAAPRRRIGACPGS